MPKCTLKHSRTSTLKLPRSNTGTNTYGSTVRHVRRHREIRWLLCATIRNVWDFTSSDNSGCSFDVRFCSTLSTQSNSGTRRTAPTSPYAATSDAQQGCAELYATVTSPPLRAVSASVGSATRRFIQHSPTANLSGNPSAALDPLRVRVLRVDRTLRCPYLLFETRM